MTETFCKSDITALQENDNSKKGFNNEISSLQPKEVNPVQVGAHKPFGKFQVIFS